jgi:hypothetical protein
MAADEAVMNNVQKKKKFKKIPLKKRHYGEEEKNPYKASDNTITTRE